jgi:hypothetical protein
VTGVIKFNYEYGIFKREINPVNSEKATNDNSAREIDFP